MPILSLRLPPIRVPGLLAIPALLVSLVLTSGIVGCARDPGETPGSSPGGEPTEPAPELTGDALRIEDARAVQVPGGGTGAVYLRVINPTERDDLLEAVVTPAAKVAEVHETVEEDGVMRMRAFPQGMSVPAQSAVALEPGGKHVMLMALEEPLEPGREIAVELQFRDAGSLRLTVPVVKIGS